MKLTPVRLSTFLTFVLVAALAVLASSRIDAQVLYGALTGNVTDASSAAVPNATVTALNAGTGTNRQATTDDHGVFLFNDLQAGSYRLTVSAPSFGTVVQSGIDISVNTVRRVDVQLALAQVNQTVNVEASGATLQTDRADGAVEFISGKRRGSGHETAVRVNEITVVAVKQFRSPGETTELVVLQRHVAQLEVQAHEAAFALGDRVAV